MTNKQKIKRINDYLEANGFTSLFKPAQKSLLNGTALKFKCPIVLAGDTIKYELDYIEGLRLSSLNGKNQLIAFMERLTENNRG